MGKIDGEDYAMSCTAQISVHVLDLHSAVTGSARQTQEVREDEREEATKMRRVKELFLLSPCGHT